MSPVYTRTHVSFSIITLQRFLFAGGVLLVVLSAKFWLMYEFGSALPVWDQIDAEGEMVLRPWKEGWLRAAYFWHPHNEHRVVLTRLYTWGLVALNGQWDAYVQTVLNAIIHGALGIFLITRLRACTRGKRFIVLAGLAALIWFLPLGWENTIHGFQSQFYFLVWLSLLQFWLVLRTERATLTWGIGLLCGGLALGALASGFLSSAAIIAVVLWQVIRRRALNTFQVITMAICLVWVTIGWTTRHHVPFHDSLRAQGVGELVTAFAKILAWPLNRWIPVGMLLIAPGCVALVKMLQKNQMSAFERFFVATSTWVVLTMLATAVVRGGTEGMIASRYLDLFSIGLILQATALLSLLPKFRYKTAATVIWFGLVVIGLGVTTRDMWKYSLIPQKSIVEKRENHTRIFVATGDASSLLNKPYLEIPYPSGETLAERWQHASIQNLLPAVVRKPVPITPAENMSGMEDLPAVKTPVLAVSPRAEQSTAWTWCSAPQSDKTLPILRFQVIGNLTAPPSALSFALVSENEKIVFYPSEATPTRWKTVNLVRPQGEWWIELTDQDSQGFVAITAPVELGWMSYAAEKAIKHHQWFALAGLSMLLGTASLEVVRRRRAQSVE